MSNVSSSSCSSTGLIPSLKEVREIEDRALVLIWDAELGPGNRSLPEAWKSNLPETEAWKSVVEVPKSRGKQIGLLRIETGANATEVVTKPTQLLVEHLHEVGNFDMS